MAQNNRLPEWVECELASPVGEGEGRNNQMIRVAPTMLRHGWTREEVFEEFKRVYELEDDDSKDGEILRVIRNAAKYAESGDQESGHDRETRQHLARIEVYARRKLPHVLTNYPWPLDALCDNGWCNLPAAEQRRQFIGGLFALDDVVWCGTKFHSGQPKHARHFRPAADWILSASAWPFISHCTFRAGAFSRCKESVVERKYLVIESDTLTFEQTLAVFSWLHNAHEGMRLRAVVFSGKKSLHGWFDWPDNDEHELAAMLRGLQCDPATMRQSQPVRLPGVIRPETGKLQELLYLDAGQAR